MKLYQIVDTIDNRMHAGTKAVSDVVNILEKINFDSIFISRGQEELDIFSKIKRQIGFYKQWKGVYKKIENDSLLLIQHPNNTMQFGKRQILDKLKKEKNVKIVFIIHDIETLRFKLDFYAREYKDMVDFADIIIAHNPVMKSWLIGQGIDKEKIVSLEIFDYLIHKFDKSETIFSKRVTIAGNLDVEKSPYVYKLADLKNIQFDLLGVNYKQKNQISNINYKGSFPPDDVPNQLVSGFGLVWDGDSLETCSGVTGNYLRYNNPHKLSLYLASKMPVIVWAESAEAAFVKEHNLGISVHSLKELEDILGNMTEKEYKNYVNSVEEVSKKIRAGHYLTQAIYNSIEKLLKKTQF
ncbi:MULTISPECIES: sugar transferase [unclassified Gemella]|uniref:sugar transferase n=1 Tax=unclassified Gemella TaxID=2624949 RepID=UPI0015CF9238|nr:MULTISPECIES: sugar transferase [unclassified Gemella]MBF0709857.1 sugar transferase [Gemella sp. GL1.1]NYS27201.1 sugar transferase [Gemella sp. GL1]